MERGTKIGGQKKEAQILMMSVGRKQQSAGENYIFQESGF